MDNELQYKSKASPRLAGMGIGTVAGAGAGAGLELLAKKLLAKKYPAVAPMLNSIPNSAYALGGGMLGAGLGLPIGYSIGDDVADNRRYKQLLNDMNEDF